MTNNGQTLVLCERCQRLYSIRNMARKGETDFICKACDDDRNP